MELKLNYLELSFVMGITNKESKEIFSLVLEKDRVGKKDEISTDNEELKESFTKIHSIDDRYHKKNPLDLNLMFLKDRYKNFLSDIACIKKGGFTGGKTVFNKVLSDEQIKWCENSFKEKRTYLGLGKNKNSSNPSD